MIVNTICEHLSRKIILGELQNFNMIQIIEHIGSYLNLQTIPNYCKNQKISYNGAKKFRKVHKIFGVKFLIDN